MRKTKATLLALGTLALLPLVISAPFTSWAEQREDQSMRGSTPDPETARAGREIYDQSCAYCHGPEGKGDGPVALFLAREMAPRPRDFTSEPFKFRSTASGELPTDEDLMRIVSRGRPGLMPGFAGLSLEERRQVIAYLKSLVPEFVQPHSEPEALSLGSRPATTAASVASGKEVYDKLQCAKCHGEGGRGDGPSAATLETTQGLKILPTDLTRPSSYGGGHEPQDIYRTFMTGLNGVPMPSYAGVVSEEETWALVDYVLSLDREGSIR